VSTGTVERLLVAVLGLALGVTLLVIGPPPPNVPQEPSFGTPIGLATYRVSRSIGRRERLVVFDAEGRSRVCAAGRWLTVELATPSRIVFQDFADARGDLYEVDGACATEPRLVVSLPALTGIRRPYVACVTESPDGILAVTYEDRDDDPVGLALVDDRWEPIATHGSCAWLDGSHLLVHPDDPYGRANSGPYAVNAWTGEIAFLPDPVLLAGLASPDGRRIYASRPQRIIDLQTGETLPIDETLWAFKPEWSPDGTRLLSDGEGDGPTHVVDVRDGVIYQAPSSFWRSVRILTRSTIAIGSARGLRLLDFETGRSRAAVLPDAHLDRFHSPTAYALVAPGVPSIALVPARDLPARRVGVAGVRAPIPPGWRVQDCRSTSDPALRLIVGPGCELNGYTFDRMLVPPIEVFTEGEPYVAFGVTADPVDTVVAQLSIGADSECSGDVDCYVVEVRRHRIARRPFTVVRRIFYEWLDTICLTRSGNRTVMIAGGCTSDFNPTLRFIFDRLRIPA